MHVFHDPVRHGHFMDGVRVRGVGVVRAIVGVTENVHSNSVLPLAGPLKVDSTITLSPQNLEAHHL